MNNFIIKSWNSVVTNDDDVYFLGDFGLCSKKVMSSYLSKLNGYKYFIKGNHDKSNMLNWLVNTHQISWWKYGYEFNYTYKGVKYTFILSHYNHQPTKENVICLYGHSHGNSHPVNIPLSIENIIERIFLIQ